MAINVQGFPALADNYFWFLSDNEKKQSIIFDPGEPLAFIKKIDFSETKPIGILITHGDWDHSDGVPQLVKKYECPVFASSLLSSSSFSVDQKFSGGEKMMLLNQDIEIIATPGHRHDHISFYFPGLKTVFCGDTLFISGCGRLSSADAGVMWQSICRLRDLPDDTKICCGHNYTLNNLRFARFLEPERIDLKEYMDQWMMFDQKNAMPCVSFLRDEKKFNPFLRADCADLKKTLAMEKASGVEVFAEIRLRKDNF